MAAELRSEHHRDLERLEIALGGLLAVIPDAVDHATRSLLSGDVALRAEVDRWQTMVVAISDDVDHTAEVIIARQAPMAGELRFLMSCVRLVLNVSDTIDLVAEVGGTAALAWEPSLPTGVTHLLESVGREASGAWSHVSELWHGRQSADRGVLRLHEDHLAELRTALAAELAAAGTGSIVTGELLVAAHCYQRMVRQALFAGRLIEGVAHPGPYRSPEHDGTAGEGTAGDVGKGSGGAEGGDVPPPVEA